MAGFIGGRAIIAKDAIVCSEARVYGPSRIGSKSLVDCHTTIGYPSRPGLRRLLGKNTTSLDEALDEASSGAVVGEGVVVRRGTVVYEDTVLSDGVETGHGVLIREGSRIGRGSLIGSYSVLDGRVVVGEKVSIQTGVYIPGPARIGDRVFIGPRVVFTNDRYPPSKRLAETVVEEGAVIGANAVIVAGVRIGAGAVVAAGAVVTRDVEPETVVVGVPARPVYTRRLYEEKKAAYEASEGRGHG